MRRIVLWITLISVLAGCTHQGSRNDILNTINVLSAWENPVKLTCSQLGKSIRYVPLETTDSSLIGDNYNVHLLKNHILVRTDNRALLFDKETGKYLRQIGHLGDDPEGYLTNVCFIHPEKEEIGFPHHDELVKYDLDGRYIGEMDFPAGGLSNSCYPLLGDSSALVYRGQSFSGNENFLLFQTSGRGEVKDSVVLLNNGNAAVNPAEIQSISVFKGLNAMSYIGLLGYNGSILIQMKDNKLLIIPTYYPSLWYCEENIRFREPFSDTIFTVKEKALEPFIVFNRGERRMPKEKEGEKEGTSQYIAVTYVMETPHVIYFQCIKDLYSKRELSNGLYNKSNGWVGVDKNMEGFEDDLTHFMPFLPESYSSEGEFVSTILPTDIWEWQKENEEANLPEALRNLREDDNPVCVIIEP